MLKMKLEFSADVEDPGQFVKENPIAFEAAKNLYKEACRVTYKQANRSMNLSEEEHMAWYLRETLTSSTKDFITILTEIARIKNIRAAYYDVELSNACDFWKLRIYRIIPTTCQDFEELKENFNTYILTKK